jgi:nucleoside-diphosphate-sugar epimerase
MSDALIGYTGYVGGSILRERPFDACFRSSDIDSIRGSQFDTIVCCGAPAEKWRANRDSDEDSARLATLTNALSYVRARRFVLISTVDVYPSPSGVDERTVIDATASQPYGRHRYELEEFCRGRFDTTVVRLPGLYGHGLKKNAIFDLLNDRPVEAIPGNARFQFYDTERVWSDVERVLEAKLPTANITAEPVSMTTVAQEVFGRELPTPWNHSAPSYDVRSIHAGLVGGRDGYWFDASTVISGLQCFVASERGR